MIEQITVKYVGYFGPCIDFDMTINGDVASYEYSSLFDIVEIKDKVNNISNFIKAVEEIDIPSLKNKYIYEDVILDGTDFTLRYKETGKRAKIIHCQYFPDKIIDFLSEIELLIPEVLFFPKVDFDKWFNERMEDFEVDDPEDLYEKIKAEFNAAPTWAKKNMILDNAFDCGVKL